MKELNRRDFVKFMGGSTLGLAMGSQLFSCKPDDFFTPLAPSSKDDLLLAQGFNYDLLIGWGDSISEKDTFGYNNDFNAFLPIAGKKDEALLWVNHEYVHPLFISNSKFWEPRTKENVELERYNMGGSLLKINNIKGKWQVDKLSNRNFRITSTTKIPFAAGVKVRGQSESIGMVTNCSGGKTPWGTILSCEENYYKVYGFRNFGEKEIRYKYAGWQNVYPYDPELYGWVVEIDPITKKAKKHTSMGRFAHESATVAKANDGRVVVYSGDDDEDEHIYKFISDSSTSLDKGKLYVANLEKGKWESLDIEDNPELKKKFKTQLNVQIYTREAAKVVGASPCDRPEDIVINPITNEVFIALSNNYDKKKMHDPKNNFYGSILKIKEKNDDFLSTEFEYDHAIIGGEQSGLACPDNLAFDKKGNLWVCNDISGKFMNKDPYKKFKNNGLFYIPLHGKNAGKVIQIASAPTAAEFTGPCFSDDYKTLFLSVQHPGETSRGLNDLTSHWPDGKKSIPRPAVVQISGPNLDYLMK